MKDGLERESAENAAFEKQLEAVFSADDRRIKDAAAALDCADPLSAQAKVLRAFAAAWCDGDVRSADDLLSHAAVDPDTEPFRLRQVTLLVINRLEGNIAQAEKIADAIHELGDQRWSALSLRAMTRTVARARP